MFFTPPCVGPDAWMWNLRHADHTRLVGPCLACSKAVNGCSTCPLKEPCLRNAALEMIQGGIAHIEHSGKVYCSKPCTACGNPCLGKKSGTCSPFCKEDVEWTYKDAEEQMERFRLIAAI
jgi:hypothetical protein